MVLFSAMLDSFSCSMPAPYLLGQVESGFNGVFLGAASGLQNVMDNRGPALSLVGMAVVFVALALIASFIAALPHVLEFLDPWLPKLHGEKHSDSPPSPAEALPAREERIVAAIGYVLHQEMTRAKQ